MCVKVLLSIHSLRIRDRQTDRQYPKISFHRPISSYRDIIALVVLQEDVPTSQSSKLRSGNESGESDRIGSFCSVDGVEPARFKHIGHRYMHFYFIDEREIRSFVLLTAISFSKE